MKVEVQLVKAFTKNAQQGNPAGVVLNAERLSDTQRLKVAQAVGFSETAFVEKSDQADFKVRFFTPKQEVDFCGHATVATFHTLVEQGVTTVGSGGSATVTQQTLAGTFPVKCYADGKIMMTQREPIFGAIETNRQLIAGLLSLSENELGELPIQPVKTVTPVLIIPIVSLQVLRKIKPQLAQINQYSEQNDGGCWYVFTSEALNPQSDIAARSFDPIVGIDEDAATGSAAGPLGCYADKYIHKGGKKQFVIDQGFDMDMNATLYVDVASTVLVGGYASVFDTKQIVV